VYWFINKKRFRLCGDYMQYDVKTHLLNLNCRWLSELMVLHHCGLLSSVFPFWAASILMWSFYCLLLAQPSQVSQGRLLRVLLLIPMDWFVVLTLS